MEENKNPYMPQSPQQTEPSAAPTPPPAPAQPPAGQPAQPPTGQPVQPPTPAQNPYAAPAQPASPMPGAGGFENAPYNPTPGAYPPPAPVMQQPNSNHGTGPLVCGILSIVLSGPVGLVLAIVSLVMGSKAAKQFGKNGKLTGAKVCSIIGLVVSILWIIALVVFGIGVAQISDDPELQQALDEEFATLEQDSKDAIDSVGIADTSDSSSAIDDQKQAVEDASMAEIAKLENLDSSVVAPLAAEFDEGLYEETQLYMSDMGLTSDEFIRWLMEDATYSVDDVTALEDKATVFLTVTHRDAYSFATHFANAVDELGESEEIAYMTQDEAMAELGKTFRKSMDKTADETIESSIFMDLEKEGDAWVVDQDEWKDQVEYLYGAF